MQFFLITFSRILLILAFFVLGACASTPQKLTFTQDIDKVWADEIIELAQDSYVYAQMSTNAYRDEYDGNYIENQSFNLGPKYKFIKTLSQPNDKIGLAYHVYQKGNDENIEEIVLVFRGTEFTHLNDWIYGNIGTAQRNRAVNEAYENVKAAYPDVNRVVTSGHSLGGGLATHVSLNRETVHNYVFNTSPRFSINEGCENSQNYCANERHSIVEYGEINKLLRLLGREPTQTYTSINCWKGFKPLGDHTMAKLANCLTRIAAIGKNEAAKGANSSVLRNELNKKQEGSSKSFGEQWVDANNIN